MYRHYQKLRREPIKQLLSVLPPRQKEFRLNWTLQCRPFTNENSPPRQLRHSRLPRYQHHLPQEQRQLYAINKQNTSRQRHPNSFLSGHKCHLHLRQPRPNRNHLLSIKKVARGRATFKKRCTAQGAVRPLELRLARHQIHRQRQRHIRVPLRNKGGQQQRLYTSLSILFDRRKTANTRRKVYP